MLHKQSSLEKEITKITTDKGLYWNREKSEQEKRISLSATKKEIAVTELCLELTQRTLSAIDRMINDFGKLNQGTGSTVYQ